MGGMAPGDYPRFVTRGDTFRFGVGLGPATAPADLTGYTLRFQIRFAVPGGTFVNPSKAAGDLIHATAALSAGPAAAGTTFLRVSAPPSASELWPPGVHLYDAELTAPSGERTTYLLSDLVVGGDVSRP